MEFDDGKVLHLLGSIAPLFDEQARPRGCIGEFVDITDRKHTEQRSAKRKARLRLALDAGRMGTWNWDIAAGTHDWNDEMYRQLGYTPGSVKPCCDAWAMRIVPEDRAGAEAQVRESFEHGGDYRCEYRVLDENGRVRWLDGRCRTDCDADGQPVRTYGVVIDVTAERVAAEAIRESERYMARDALRAAGTRRGARRKRSHPDRQPAVAALRGRERQCGHGGVRRHKLPDRVPPRRGLGGSHRCRSRAVIGRTPVRPRDEFSLEYPCHAPRESGGS